MSLQKPSILSGRNVDGSVFLTWSSVFNANKYQIEFQINKTGQKNIYYSYSTNFLIKNLEYNGFYSVRVRALNDISQSEWSFGVMIRPKLRQSLSCVYGVPNEKKGFITLRWTSTPTDFGFHVERCDIGDHLGYKRIGWIPFSQITTFEDQTNCQICQGHYYTVTFRDNQWDSGAGVLSKKLFCISPTDIDYENQFEANEQEFLIKSNT
jgi:hypothetical protein